MKFRLPLFLVTILPLRAAVVSQAVQMYQFLPASDPEVLPWVAGCGGWGQSLALQADGKLMVTRMTVASPYAWFTIAVGERLDAAFVLGNLPFNQRGPHSVFMWDVIAPEPDGTWLFGWWSTSRPFAYDPGSNDCYGWLRLGVIEGKLIIVDDAAELGGAGIYAGTLIAVPEPSAAGLAGVIVIAARRKRRRVRA